MLRVRNASKKKRSCGTPILRFRTYSSRSKCCSQPKSATTCSAHYLHQVLPRSHKPTMQEATRSLLLAELPGIAQQQPIACLLASLPMRMGRLGLRSAARLGSRFLGILGQMHCLCSKIARSCKSDRLGHVHRSNWVFGRVTRNIQRAGPLWFRWASNKGKLASKVKTRSTRSRARCGRTVGNTSRLPLLDTIPRRQLYSLNRAPLTRRTFDNTLEQVVPMFCVVVLLDPSSHCNLYSSVLSCWEDFLRLL